MSDDETVRRRKNFMQMRLGIFAACCMTTSSFGGIVDRGWAMSLKSKLKAEIQSGDTNMESRSSDRPF
jgi:hypothetical protein